MMSGLFWYRGSLYCLLLLLAGCASYAPVMDVKTPALQASWQAHQAQTQTLDDWRISGQIALQTADQNWTARVFWSQQGDHYELRLNAPLGQGVLRLDGDAKQVVLYSSDQPPLAANDPDRLLQEALGLPIPVRGLYYWIRGIPSAATTSQQYQLYETGELYTLVEDGWHIKYTNYMNVDTFSLPQRLFMEREDLYVRIAISQWQLSPKVQNTRAGCPGGGGVTRLADRCLPFNLL